MLLSAFTFTRNTDKLYYPVKESVLSVLPIAGEVIVALGKGDEDDKTEAIINSIGDSKIKIFHRVWDPALYASSRIFAHETDFALSHCTGTWCLYLQADEVLHEDDLNVIVEACKKYEHNTEVEGLLFKYVHFWGDYEHLLDTHGLIRHEIRVIRNGIGAYSYKDAVSFRKGNDEKLKVVEIPARIFHYGYMRPPELMGAKRVQHNDMHHGTNTVIEKPTFDWGPLGHLQKFTGTHPAVMRDWIKKYNWSASLNFSKPALFERNTTHKHLKPKYRFLTWIERNFNGNRQIFGFENYKVVGKWKTED